MAGRVTLEPLEWRDPNGAQPGGHYLASLVSGAVSGLGANNPILSFRWVDPVKSCVLLRVSASVAVTTAFTTAQNLDLEAVIARSFTASDSGGTAVTLGAGNKSRTVMGNSLVGDLRMASTGTLTAGTRTLDAAGFGAVAFNNANGLGNAESAHLFRTDMTDAAPVILAQNEGFIVRAPTALGAVGVVKYYVTIRWAEVPTVNL